MREHATSAPEADLVTAAYAGRAQEYIEAVGRIEHVERADLDFVGRWAKRVNGRILDIGSGPGQWTEWLRRAGHAVEGVEPVREFVASARAAYPDSRYRVGRAESLPEADAVLGGILAWYSLIHVPPLEIDRALGEFARVVRPGGSLLLGFFAADQQSRFDHAVAPAYFWPVPLLAARLERAGFEVHETVYRPGRPERAHGAIVAERGRA